MAFWAYLRLHDVHHRICFMLFYSVSKGHIAQVPISYLVVATAYFVTGVQGKLY
ncbi:hypothetical protein AUEXF2481DRAFT_41020 [Aureobasidium subglaciale EXF-2481]|uniref:Uncharacterized protein n=1 Tax=Aureobasidium subglaciale (strain EXF-2481) TaxID=1043005 RepID=A0A074Y9I2_AURSE|nr:uncharacterized protein AUEXF2481DRAFT_41020 [Aureobasidium subglaciale EXF-2481]KEQ94430.1 hypothetical protein AUEXF2481DRAFT_41020 [Aureobasidium subglaciale EXF-2481]